MQVVGDDGDPLGCVVAVRDNDFRLQRQNEPDLYVPFDAVQTVQGDYVVLWITSLALNAHGWEVAHSDTGASH